MSRVGKYMVYNPRKDKPVKYYYNFNLALGDADILNKKENVDVLVLKVVANVENKKVKIHRSQYNEKRERCLEVIED